MGVKIIYIMSAHCEQTQNVMKLAINLNCLSLTFIFFFFSTTYILFCINAIHFPYINFQFFQ